MTKTPLTVTVVGKDESSARRWVREVSEASSRSAGEFMDVRVSVDSGDRKQWGQVVVVDAELPRLAEWLMALDVTGETKGRAIFLIVPENK